MGRSFAPRRSPAPLARAQPPASHRIIVDTDFALPPQDDGLALAFALNSPELDIVGITTVAGNYNLARANADVLRMLEIAGRTDIPVHPGASHPLVHEKDAFATTHYGRWWSDEPAPAPPGGFAKKALDPEPAADFMVRAVAAAPGRSRSSRSDRSPTWRPRSADRRASRRR